MIFTLVALNLKRDVCNTLVTLVVLFKKATRAKERRAKEQKSEFPTLLIIDLNCCSLAYLLIIDLNCLSLENLLIVDLKCFSIENLLIIDLKSFSLESYR